MFLIFFGTAAVLAVIGVSLIRSYEQKLLAYTYETEAVISDMTKHGRVYYPIFEYCYNGEIHHKKSSVGSSPPMYHTGDTVIIKVNPDNPEQFVEVNGRMTKLASAILFGIAVVFSLVSAILFFG